MKDQFGREISYLRLSVTAKCNLRCIYCSPGNVEGCDFLTADEIIRVVRTMAGLGINKVRITGGEPLQRTDLEEIISGISSIGSVHDIPMTTNAIGLTKRIHELCEAGLTRLNISLDTLSPEKYAKITGCDALEDVLESIDYALDLGINVKVNAVLIKGLNDNEVDDLIALGKDRKISVRFIEMMPIGLYAEHNRDKAVYNTEILSRHHELIPMGYESGGVSEVYQMPGYVGTVGLISSVSHAFCSSCNRIRLTSDGKIKPCLGNNGEFDIVPALRDGEGDLETIIYDGIYGKPRGHNFGNETGLTRNMRATGG